MDKEPARVVAIYNDGKVVVEMEPNSACQTCSTKSFSSDKGNSLRRIVAKDPIGVNFGTHLSRLHKWTFIIYLYRRRYLRATIRRTMSKKKFSTD